MSKNNESISRRGTHTITTTMRRPLLWLVAALVVLPTVITCSVGSKGSTAPVAIAVNLPHANGPAVAAQILPTSAPTWWERILAWIWEPDAAVAQTSAPTLYRLVVEVGAADLPSQVVTVPLDSLGPQTVTVQLNVLSGPGRTFRATIEELSSGQSGYTPVYAGCHSGVDLQPNTPANVTIALAETTTCLRVIVLGGGPQLDQPLPGIRVLRHDANGGYVNDRISDANGVADFGELVSATQSPSLLSFLCNHTATPQQCAILSFVLARTESPASETVITLNGVPMSGDIRFNVSKNQFGDVLNRDYPPQLTGTATLATVSTSGVVSLGVSGRKSAEVLITTNPTQAPVVAYQRQSNGLISVAAEYSIGTEVVGCAVKLDNNSANLDLTSLSNPVQINFFDNPFRLIGKRTRYNAAIIDLRCPGCSGVCSLTANEQYEVLLEESVPQPILGQRKEYGVLSSSLAQPPSTSAQITFAVRGPGFMSVCNGQELFAGEIMWCPAVDPQTGSGYQEYEDADALVWETRWTVGGKVYQRVEIFAPYDSPFPLSRLVTLPADLGRLVPPDPGFLVTVANSLETKLTYLGVARADSMPNAITLTWPILLKDTVLHGDRFQRLLRPMIGGTGVFDDDVLFNGQTIRHFESSYTFTEYGAPDCVANPSSCL